LRRLSKKKKRSNEKVNPVIEKARKEAYEAGFKNGLAAGEVSGINKAIGFFMDKLDGLETVKGIGPKAIDKIKKQIGEQYFTGEKE
jgi:flagellar biosynthesis/type III secretory pathway protein FliH